MSLLSPFSNKHLRKLRLLGKNQREKYPSSYQIDFLRGFKSLVLYYPFEKKSDITSRYRRCVVTSSTRFLFGGLRRVFAFAPLQRVVAVYNISF